MSDQDQAIINADEVYEHVKAINHTLISRTSIPAPIAYDILGNLKLAGNGLGEVAGHLARGLSASLEEYDVYDKSDREPAESVAIAKAALVEAATMAENLGAALSRAQSAITLQGYTPQ